MKVDGLQSLLEENGLRLTHSAHLAQYIPPLLQQEKEKLCSELDGTFMMVLHVMEKHWQWLSGLSRIGRLNNV